MEYEIVDVTNWKDKKFLYKCISPMPYRKRKKRSEYLKKAIPNGLKKKILYWKGDPVGQIEYAPANYSGYPIYGEKLLILNCIWVLRKAKGHRFGKILMNEMIRQEKWANAIATIGLEGHWSPWMKKQQMEYLGFKSIDAIKVKSLYKKQGYIFKIHLMWLPLKPEASKPRWDKNKMLEGVQFCIAHPLYHPQKIAERNIFKLER